ncbi:alpha/beta hydrolase fold domain-containing protein [Lysinibacillus sp. NPDC093692]|uniref:alpha/beta hydrolase fold domain-containing protein n=1 Tax=Lysinibacillus sp. NPDC093692 TaxID=3390578 RepID=UPI003CFDA902
MITKRQLTSWRPKGIIQWLLTALSVVMILITVMVIYPFPITYTMSIISMMGLVGTLALYTPWFLVILTVFNIALLILATWKKARIAQFILIPLLLLNIFLNVEPIIKMENYAKSENVSVSLNTHFFNNAKISSTFTQDVVYEKTTDGIELKLDVWPAHASSKTALNPAVINVHGGGWVEGDKNSAPHWNQYLSELGYTVFDVQYRMPPHAEWKDEVGDVKSAIGWVVEHADTYKIDPTKINLMGQSAGGNLAMLAAYSMGNEELSASTNVAPTPINSVINIYGPTDMTKFYQGSPSPDYVQNVMKEYIGGTPSQFPDRYKKLSPINYIGEHTPPTITFLGMDDRIVPIEQAKILDTALSKNNVLHELYLLPHADHIYDGTPGNLNTQVTFEKVKMFLEKYNK